jgi:hypothetical protein
LFHLLIDDASQRWNGSAAAMTAIERGFTHGLMKSSSEQFRSPRWLDWHGTSRMVPPGLQRVARSFVNLQQQRHSADYNNYRRWTFSEVLDVIDDTEAAFQDWSSVRMDPVAGDYLLSMLLGKRS